MIEARPISSAAASRERTGLSHIGQLVELWLARYDSDSVKEESVEEVSMGKDSIDGESFGAQSPHGESFHGESFDRAACGGHQSSVGRDYVATAAVQNIPVATGYAQNTFGFYQSLD